MERWNMKIPTGFRCIIGNVIVVYGSAVGYMLPTVGLLLAIFTITSRDVRKF